MTFRDAVLNQMTTTENGMPARVGSADSCTDLFFKIGASRGQNIIPQFAAAYGQEPELALRIAAWARDIRGGAGERKAFRDILATMAVANFDHFAYLASLVHEVGRWDDLEEVIAMDPRMTSDAGVFAAALWCAALVRGDALAAKWAPRKGPVANQLRKMLGVSPRDYRRLIVDMSNTVETKMCARDWDNINFSHVPSVASARYRKAFKRHTTKYAEWAANLSKGDPSIAKVNAEAIFPHDVVRGLTERGAQYNFAEKLDATDVQMIQAQWDALPNYLGEASVLAMVDVSGSMCQPAGKNASVQAIDVSIALGMYCADKNRGAFKDLALTFSGKPELLHLRGDIANKYRMLNNSNWAMNTNLEAAFEKILNVAVAADTKQEDMPAMLLILSDMQFDSCVVGHTDTALEMIKKRYAQAGYEMPRVVFWNLVAHDNMPVKFDEKGTALVSGFSPSVLKAILKADFEQFTPRNIMLQAVMDSRYDWPR